MIHTCYSTIIPTSISLVAKIWWYSTLYNGGKIMYDHNRMDAKQGEVANYHSIPNKKRISIKIFSLVVSFLIFLHRRLCLNSLVPYRMCGPHESDP